MALDLDLYEGVFALLGVETSGNPVNDAVYLLLLPMVVLYLYTSFVIGRSRFGSMGVRFIMMFIVGYVIIEKGFYNLFATYSIYLLGIIMVWHVFGFVLGSKDKKDYAVTQPASEAVRGGLGSFFKKSIPHASSLDPEARRRAIIALTTLGNEWDGVMSVQKLVDGSKLHRMPEDTNAQRRDIQKSATDILYNFDYYTATDILKKAKLPPDLKSDLEKVVSVKFKPI